MRRTAAARRCGCSNSAGVSMRESVLKSRGTGQGKSEANTLDRVTFGKIVLTYPPGDDPEQTADEVEKLEASIETLFSKKHFDPAIGVWNSIAMTTCMSISEDELTVSKTRLFTEWRLEYMTLKADDGQLGAPS